MVKLQADKSITTPESERHNMLTNAIKRWLVVVALFGCATLQAAEKQDDPQAKFKERLTVAVKLVQQKQFDKAEKELLSLKAERGLGAETKEQVGLQLLTIYAGIRDIIDEDAAKAKEQAKELCALQGVSDNAKLKALKYLAAKCGFYAQFMGRYYNLQPEKEIDQMVVDYPVYMQELVRLQPDDANTHINLGAVYLDLGEADKAIEQYKAALALPKANEFQQGDALTGLASAALLKNDRAAAVQYCKDLVGRGLKTHARYRVNPVEEAKYALNYLEEPELDYLKLPYYTGAKAFPKPQQAEYTEQFVPLTKVALELGKDVKPDDLRIKLLQVKFKRFGIAIDKSAPFTVRINSKPEPAAPEKAEGYSLAVSKNEAIINGHDSQGVLWGIVSLIQLVDQGQQPKIRVCNILDWPDTARRGFLQGYWKDALEFMLFCKMNTVVSQRGEQITVGNAFEPWTPLQKEVCTNVCRTFDAFGLAHYWGNHHIAKYPILPLSSERTFDLHVKVCTEIAKNGGHVYFAYDDNRYPMHPEDIKTYKTAANIDAKYMTRLYKAVHDKYPDFHLVFCPPFYWGPDATASYPEPREPYLKSLGEFLDPAIEVFWTGPRVKGYEKNREQVAWFTQLTKHKPMIFQNGTGPHNLLSYITDETPEWKTWHYDGFFENDIEGFLKNAHMGMEAPQTTTLADCMWNVKGYNAAASIRNGVAMLFGKDMFDLIDPAREALEYLDKYKYGSITPEAMTEIPEIEKRVAIADAAYKKGVEYNAFSLENFPGALGRGVGFAQRLLKSTQNPPDFFGKYKKDIEETQALALKETGVDAKKGDILKLPIDLIGGQFIVYDNKCPKRFATLLRGKQTTIPSARLNFECDPFPPTGAYELFLSAQDDDAEAQCKIRISVNDKTIFEGPSEFTRYGWSLKKYILPFDALQRNNSVVIECIEDTSGQQGPPWFMVNYIVLKKATK